MNIEVDLKLTPKILAQAFADMMDEQQAQFFIEVAEIAKTWRNPSNTGNAGMQWWYVGRHLRNCECSTFEAREMIDEIASAMNYQDNV